jgi:hypothetical protein
MLALSMGFGGCNLAPQDVQIRAAKTLIHQALGIVLMEGEVPVVVGIPILKRVNFVSEDRISVSDACWIRCIPRIVLVTNQINIEPRFVHLPRSTMRFVV